MRSSIFKIIAVLAVQLFLTSCATTSLVDTWRNHGVISQKHHKLLLIYSSKNDSVRRVYENILANELKQNGVTAESGQKFVPGGVKVDRQTLDNGIKESGADGVITVQMIIDEQIDMEPVTGDITSDNWYPSVFSSGDRYAHFYVSPDQPLNISSFEVGKIQVNLFDSQSGKLQWAATIKASKPGDVVSVAKDLAHIVVRSLKSEDLI